MSKRHSDLQARHLPWMQPQRVKAHHIKNANFLGAWHDIASGASGERHQRAQRVAEAQRDAQRAQKVEAQPEAPNVEATDEVQAKNRTPVRYQVPVDDITKD